MRLSKRIRDICECVNQGESVADIGTDHAYVPMFLIKQGIIDKAIMSDISEGSLSKAYETFELSHLQILKDNFRIGDGLESIKAAEVDDIIIAGLGGHTIIDILSKDENKSKSFKKLILQPRKFSGSLRKYLLTHGWKIDLEKLSPEGKFVCEIIVATPSNLYEIPNYRDDDIRWSYPESFENVDYNLLKKRLDWKLGSIDKEIDNISKSNNNSIEKIIKLKNEKIYLEVLLNKCHKNFG